MAQTLVEKVVVVELTKYGFKDGTGAYVGWSKQLKDSEKTPVVPGRVFEMELYIADSGKKYMNKIVKQLDVTSVPPVPVTTAKQAVDTVRAQRTLPAESSEMSKAEWAAKDVRISRQGVIQAAVLAVAETGFIDLDGLYTEAESLANKMLDFVNQK